MALIWYEGFEETNNLNQLDFNPGSGASISSSGARTGSNCMRIAGNNNGANIVLGASFPTACVGLAISQFSYPNGSSQNSVLDFSHTGSTILVGLCVLSTGQLQIRTGASTLLGSPTDFQIPIGQYHYAELDVVFAGGASGQATAYLDGSQILQVTGQNFSTTCTGFGMQGGNALYDDMYFLDHTGSAPYNAPLGDCFVVGELPSASGSFTQWSIGGSAPKPTNWQSVNETPPNGDTTFVSAAASGLRDSYDYPTFPPVTFTNVGNILAVQVMGYQETDTSGLGMLEFSARQAGVDLFSPAFTLGVGYIYNRWITIVDVNGNSWTIPNLNATEFGMKRTA